jgi:hypothetical protein
MISRYICTTALWVVLCIPVALAADSAELGHDQKMENQPFAGVRTVLYLPFKGVICLVGAVTSFPVYWLSGLDPQVKHDSGVIRAYYCSQEYLFSPEWPR